MHLSPRYRRLLWTGAAAAGALGAYAFLVEPRWILVTRTHLRIPGLAPALEGLRIALLTDFHAEVTPLSIIRRACRRAMDERPDLIAITGDFGGGDEEGLRRVMDAVAGLSAPLGVYAVPGNHDHEIGGETWHRLLAERTNIVDLTNRAVLHQVHNGWLCVAGVDDLTSGQPTFSALPPEGLVDAVVLLAHNPDHAEKARGSFDRVDLVLSGHTHGGQVRLPLIGAILNPVRHPELYEEGLVRRPWTQVYISRGVGTGHLPVRFLARPEVALLTLAAGDPEPGEGR